MTTLAVRGFGTMHHIDHKMGPFRAYRMVAIRGNSRHRNVMLAVGPFSFAIGKYGSKLSVRMSVGLEL